LENVKELFTQWHRYRAGAYDWPTFQRAMPPIQQQINTQLEAGQVCKHAKTAGTCQQILRGETSLWTFTREPGVEPANNAAERALRPAVLWRRKSCGTQSSTGHEFVERILTAVTTLRQQKRNVLEWLTNACTAALGTPAPCCLLPDSS
jgi:transposase